MRNSADTPEKRVREIPCPQCQKPTKKTSEVVVGRWCHITICPHCDFKEKLWGKWENNPFEKMVVRLINP